MKLTDEQRARMRAALIGIGIDDRSITGKNREGQRVLAGLVRSWISAYGTYNQVCYMLEQASIRGIRGYEQFRVYARRYSRKLIEQMHTIENLEYHRINRDDPETKEWLRRRELGRTSPQEGQAASGVGTRSVDRQDGCVGEAVQGDGPGTCGEVLRTGGGDGFKPAKRKRK